MKRFEINSIRFYDLTDRTIRDVTETGRFWIGQESKSFQTKSNVSKKYFQVINIFAQTWLIYVKKNLQTFQKTILNLYIASFDHNL